MYGELIILVLPPTTLLHCRLPHLSQTSLFLLFTTIRKQKETRANGLNNVPIPSHLQEDFQHRELRNIPSYKIEARMERQHISSSLLLPLSPFMNAASS